MSGPSRSTTIRVSRLLTVAAVLATGLAAAVAAPAAPAPAPAPPSAPACAPGDGVLIDAEMVAAVAASDGHTAVAPAGQSVSAGCASGHPEENLGWSTSAPDTPQDAAIDESADSDPFAPGGGLYNYAYQLADFDGSGLPRYWEPPTALHIAEWPTSSNAVHYVWRDRSTGASREAWLPTSSDCRYHGPMPAAEAPGRVADYRADGHPRIYLYDHVPLPRAARRFEHAGGGWNHYLCGAHTPADIAGPGNRLTATEAVYYSTPHWVYARGWTPALLTRLAPIWRVARIRVYDEVRTSPAARAVVAQKVWMWVPHAGYDVELGTLRARVEPTGIVVRAPGMPLHAHDLRVGGCRDGGRPDPGPGDERADTDCYFVFDRSTGLDPTTTYAVGFALRWSITTSTAGGTPVGEPMTFWTTSVREFQVGEVQVVVGR